MATFIDPGAGALSQALGSVGENIAHAMGKDERRLEEFTGSPERLNWLAQMGRKAQEAGPEAEAAFANAVQLPPEFIRQMVLGVQPTMAETLEPINIEVGQARGEAIVSTSRRTMSEDASLAATNAFQLRLEHDFAGYRADRFQWQLDEIYGDEERNIGLTRARMAAENEEILLGYADLRAAYEKKDLNAKIDIRDEQAELEREEIEQSIKDLETRQGARLLAQAHNNFELAVIQGAIEQDLPNLLALKQAMDARATTLGSAIDYNFFQIVQREGGAQLRWDDIKAKRAYDEEIRKQTLELGEDAVVASSNTRMRMDQVNSYINSICSDPEEVCSEADTDLKNSAIAIAANVPAMASYLLSSRRMDLDEMVRNAGVNGQTTQELLGTTIEFQDQIDTAREYLSDLEVIGDTDESEIRAAIAVLNGWGDLQEGYMRNGVILPMPRITATYRGKRNKIVEYAIDSPSQKPSFISITGVDISEKSNLFLTAIVNGQATADDFTEEILSELTDEEKAEIVSNMAAAIELAGGGGESRTPAQQGLDPEIQAMISAGGGPDISPEIQAQADSLRQTFARRQAENSLRLVRGDSERLRGRIYEMPEVVEGVSDFHSRLRLTRERLLFSSQKLEAAIELALETGMFGNLPDISQAEGGLETTSASSGRTLRGRGPGYWEPGPGSVVPPVRRPPGRN